MTVDEILERKRELRALKAEELERQARGEGDNFALFFLNEELHDLNSQLRALNPAHRVCPPKKTSNGMVMDYGQYREWLASERDEALQEAHQIYLDAVRDSARVLTERQRELFDLWQGGMSMTEIAERLGVNRSTVSRVLKSSKARIQAEAGKRAKAAELDGMRVFDLSEPEVARVLLSCLTPHQAVCIYLYYGEWLNLRECGELLGIDHTAVLRTVQRGLRSIQETLRCGSFTLDNVDALSDLAYELYVEAGSPDRLEPPRKRAEKRALWGRERARRATSERDEAPVECTVRTSDGLVSRFGTAHRSLDRPMSKLLTLLFELRRQGPLYRWLSGLFGKLTKRRSVK